MTWGTITDEGIAEAETLVNVLLRRDRMRWIETATRDAIPVSYTHLTLPTICSV